MEQDENFDLHPSQYIIDLIAKFFMRVPQREDFQMLKTFLDYLHGQYEELRDIAMKALEDEALIVDIAECYYHFFEIHSTCMIDTHESSYYFKHIQPDYLDPVLSPLGISIKPVGGKFPDHLSNQLLIFAYIYSSILATEDEVRKNELQKTLLQFYRKHLNKFIKEIEGKIKQCNCNYKTKFYQHIIVFAIYVLEDFMADETVVKSWND